MINKNTLGYDAGMVASRSLFIYTFSTVELPSNIPIIITFRQLKQDMQQLELLILAYKPSVILGIGNGKRTQFESFTINCFHGPKQIVPNGPESYKLLVPDLPIPVSKQPSDSFCNWTAYCLAHFGSEHALPTKLAFLHVAPQDRATLYERVIMHL